jgi:replicative DNA helicase
MLAHDLEAEQCPGGYNRDILFDERSWADLNPNDFYNTYNQVIYRTLMEMDSQDIPIDIVRFLTNYDPEVI